MKQIPNCLASDVPGCFPRGSGLKGGYISVSCQIFAERSESGLLHMHKHKKGVTFKRASNE
jgi:hypothetical protein